MKKEILKKINRLGGNTDKVKGKSLASDLLSITFNTVLYPREQPLDNTEPIYGLNDFIKRSQKLIRKDKQAFYDKVVEKYFQITKEGYGQVFWVGEKFTPFEKGTPDYEEWSDDFTDEEEAVDLKEIIALTGTKKPNFIHVFYSYGYPDAYYICENDPNPENPTLFGTDHEVFFSEVTNQGKLEKFLDGFITQEEVIELVKKRIEKI
jgi:hypothetical protein